MESKNYLPEGATTDNFKRLKVIFSKSGSLES